MSDNPRWQIFNRLTHGLESIQGTYRLSLKMGRGDEQKPVIALYQTVINFYLISTETPPLQNNGIFKSIGWTFADPLNRL